jgi:hypothetical protein
MEELGRRAHDFGLDLGQARKGARVERVLVEEQLGRRACDLVHLGATVVDHAERAAVLPPRVARALLL